MVCSTSQLDFRTLHVSYILFRWTPSSFHRRLTHSELPSTPSKPAWLPSAPTSPQQSVHPPLSSFILVHATSFDADRRLIRHHHHSPRHSPRHSQRHADQAPTIPENGYPIRKFLRESLTAQVDSKYSARQDILHHLIPAKTLVGASFFSRHPEVGGHIPSAELEEKTLLTDPSA